jgi:hypothetical protein
MLRLYLHVQCLLKFKDVCYLLVFAGLLLQVGQTTAQSFVGSTSIRPFVVGSIPVIGRGGAVGGVKIDTAGLVSRAGVGDLAGTRRGDSSKAKTTTRMVSLARLERALADHIERKDPISEELLFLAGLQRVEYVFAEPEANDIILAGPTEAWRIDVTGAAVGITSGRPAIRLDDLLEAFRTADIAKKAPGISCSIDPTAEGTARLQRFLRRRGLQFNRQTAELMKRAVGPQKITLTGVLADSHFARVMIAADFLMKRLAMELEESPLDGMPSYMDLLKSGARRGSATPPGGQTASPRWWLAANYPRLLRSENALHWQIRGPGVQVKTENAFVDRSGAIVESDKSDHQAEQWARTMTNMYPELSVAMPVFGELRNCMDLAVIAAIFTHYDLVKHVDAKLPLLTEGNQVRGLRYNVPETTDSFVSVVRARRRWVVGVSGEVDLDSWSVLNEPEIGQVPLLKPERPPSGWWWE